MAFEDLRNNPIIQKVANCSEELFRAANPMYRATILLCREAVAEEAQQERQIQK